MIAIINAGNWIIDGIVSLLGAIFSLLPTSHLSVFSSSTYADAWGIIGVTMAHWNNIIPILDVFNFFAPILGIVLPAGLAYKLANWIYKHIPQIGGFGPGSG